MAEMEIPFDLITEILTRLAVKPLTRFKCVSKSWNSLISSPSFVNHHSQSNPNPNIIVTSGDSVFSALIPDNINTNLHFSQLNHPLNRPGVGVRLVSDSCNSIILISDSTKKTKFLYNPANNTHWLLPPIPTETGVVELFGLGYDSHTDDYKVIGVFGNRGLNPETYVYSMRDNVWKFIKDELPNDECLNHLGHGVGANGVVYFRSLALGGKPMLMCFDVRTEAFSIVDCPELDMYGFEFLDRAMVDLKELRGNLCLVVNYLSEGEYRRDLLYADVWEMRESEKEASWVKLFRIQGSEIVGKGERCRFIRLITYSEDKSKLLIKVDSAWFGWYDLVTKMVKKLKITGFPDEYLPRVTMTYVESIVSVSQQ